MPWWLVIYYIKKVCSDLWSMILWGEKLIVAGHYQVPDYSKTRLQITGRSDLIIPPGLSQFNGSKTVSIQTESITVDQLGQERLIGHDINSEDTKLGWMGNLENKALVITVAALVVSVAAMFVYFRAQVRFRVCILYWSFSDLGSLILIFILFFVL